MPVIFDLDGTLIDSAPDIHAAVNRTLAEVGADPLTFDTVRSFIGNGVSVLTERVIAARALPQPHADLLAIILRHYNADPATLTVLYPNVRETLTALAKAGHALGICTNKPEGPTRAILAAFGMDHLFAAVYGGDSLPVHKPDPAPLLAAMAALGGGATVYVGDSEVDAETAARAGLSFAIFTEGYRKTPMADLPHDMAFDDFALLPGIVAQLMAMHA
ncbi:MAG: phosphoglycolate phosphatase [Pseudotabrizicola sp.]|uniref:phosphoglycolate phosphatase n=1 Tax=Pseudotabrizicola sp. TaxID=2939647 RepID=UPI002727AC60|nr:phosphoglycolate phosphatase [Pseudotabrizicola sp.]MDO9199999.1 phosphoglycolate phosphatase [Hydrogenophaga sp.]MDP2079505.1 phosphoglycolate phosphatase [Pseudotabrizicola sp.]MDZ7575785.1 phosphoglycolate phosphatase [Pseudotabrizicola sp.]